MDKRIEEIEARLKLHQEINANLASQEWIEKNCKDGGDWGKEAERAFEISKMLLKQDIPHLLSEVKRLSELLGACDSCGWDIAAGHSAMCVCQGEHSDSCLGLR